MTKQELLAILKKARLGEEKVISIYTKHLASAVFWTGMKKEDAKRVRAVFDILARDSIKHRKIVEGLIQDLQKEG